MCGYLNGHDSLACGTTAERLALMLPAPDAPGSEGTEARGQSGVDDYFPSAEDGDILPLAHRQAKDHAVNRRETRQ